MRVHVTHGPARNGWTAWHPNDAVDGLPELDAGRDDDIERIFVTDLLDLTDREYLPVVLESWWNHPGVSMRTLLGFTVPRNDARVMYGLVRPSGWGIACPYNANLMKLDRWPVPASTDKDGMVGGLCRAIKKNTTSTSHG